MPFYEITEEPTGDWYDDDEQAESGSVHDDMAELYLRAEEAWPRGAAIRAAFAFGDGAGVGCAEDAHAFDD